MILCLDAGNTRLKYGLHDGQWLVQGALDYAALDDLPGQLPQRPQRILACNVAGAAVAERIAALATEWGVELSWFRSGSNAAGLVNGYAAPTQLGADRWAALIGARACHAGAALVVMAGTATTIDVLTATDEFRGGVILPGLALMRAALVEKTADLPLAQGAFQVFPRNTDDAIVSGCLQATLGAIERLAHQAFDQPLPADFVCLLSGGAAADLAPHLDLPSRRIDNLVLEGLAHVSGINPAESRRVN